MSDSITIYFDIAFYISLIFAAFFVGCSLEKGITNSTIFKVILLGFVMGFVWPVLILYLSYKVLTDKTVEDRP